MRSLNTYVSDYLKEIENIDLASISHSQLYDLESRLYGYAYYPQDYNTFIKRLAAIDAVHAEQSRRAA